MSQSADPRFSTTQLIDGRRATRAYADLMFAFGFARLGDAITAEQLRSDAARDLDAIETNREFHRLARLAFECRIAEALRGEPHTGTLDDRCPEVIAALRLDRTIVLLDDEGDMTAWGLTRVVQLSRILEPERSLDPYHKFVREDASTPPRWHDRTDSSALWERQLNTDDSPEAIWQALRPTEAEAVKERGAKWRDAVRDTSVHRLPSLLLAVRGCSQGTIRRVLLAVTGELPRICNSFTTAPYFSRRHYEVVDPLVLAVVGTGPLLPAAECPERLELLSSVRPPVLTWVNKIPM